MGDVFISYKQDERERMRPIADGLRELGVDVWFDERLRPDRSFTEEITDTIATCRAQLVCWSPAAVASEWVLGEAEVGRQRGVLIAAMIEPCMLPPPFNMHHAESLVGWTGDARHLGWRKIVDAVGRKLDRPGLGDLAALQGSDDAAAWKKWAQKYPNDPLADAAWTKIEELELGAARQRTARDREAAKRAAEEAERRRAEQPASRVTKNPTPPAPPETRRGRGLMLPVLGVSGAIVLGAAAFFLAPRWLGKEEPEAAPATQAALVTPTLAETAEPMDVAAQGPGAAASSPASAAAPQPDPVAAEAIAAIDRISAEQWSLWSERAVADQVLNQSSISSLRAAAEAGDVRAQTLFAAALTMGYLVEGVRPDPIQIFERAARRGFAPAQNALGRFYYQGWNVDRDYSEAVRLFSLSATQGNAGGQMNLAVMYELGHGVSRDPAEAIRLYKLASDQGASSAQFHLGEIYSSDRLGPRDVAESNRFYRLAARQGHLAAQQELSRRGETW